jgi:CBS domain-containing protein
VRLRIRLLRCTHRDGERLAPSTVFCPGGLRSVQLDACLRCPRLRGSDREAIECRPPTSRRSGRDAFVAHLGGDACVGDAMGNYAVAIHADVGAGAVTRSLRAEGAVVAIVVDEDLRLVGLLDAAEVAPAVEVVPAGRLACRVEPVHEAAPLDHAIDRMVRERARALPVVDDGGRVVALLTDLDALHWVARRGRGAP